MKLYEMFFQEVKKASMSYVDRNDKIDRESGRLSIQVSKDKEDSLHKRMVFHREKYKFYKDQILKKYRARVQAQARK